MTQAATKTTKLDGGTGNDRLDANDSGLHLATGQPISIAEGDPDDVNSADIRAAIIQLFQNCLNEFGSTQIV